MLKASFGGTSGDLSTFISKASLGGEFDTIYLHISDGVVRTIADYHGRYASYCMFEEGGLLNNITTEGEYNEVLIDTEVFSFYLDYISGSKVEVSFSGTENDRLATEATIVGNIKAEIHLPAASSSLESIALWLPSSFDDDLVFDYSGEEEEREIGTVVTADLSSLREFVGLVDSSRFVRYGSGGYPLEVTSNSLIFNAEDDANRNRIGGSIEAEVKGEVTSGHFKRGFAEMIYSVGSGNVTLQFSPSVSTGPLVVCKEAESYTCIYVIGQAI